MDGRYAFTKSYLYATSEVIDETLPSSGSKAEVIAETLPGSGIKAEVIVETLPSSELKSEAHAVIITLSISSFLKLAKEYL